MIEIKHWNGSVLYTAESAQDVRSAVVEAVKSGADLTRADLTRADLTRAYLSGAYLSGANLYGANLSGANLSGAYLSGANLYGANLSGANLYGAYLSGANLYGANLYGANLYGANLSGANLYGANLYGANLYGANLYGAYLSDADLYGANLYGAKNAELVAAQTSILPDGDLIGWKRCTGGTLVKLRIPADAKRSNATGRKCRAEYAEVLEITDRDGNPVEQAVSQHTDTFTYRVGETVHPTKPFDENRWLECASGIHFYVTRIEAEA